MKAPVLTCGWMFLIIAIAIADAGEGPPSAGMLMSAIRNQDVAGVRAALRQGDNPNACGQDALTALAQACRVGDVEIVRLIVEAGVDVNAVDSQGRTPLMHAAATGVVPVIEYLLARGARIEVTTADGRNALFFACAQANASAADYLRAKGARVPENPKWVNMALFKSVLNGKSQWVEYLLSLGGDARLTDKNGRTLLHYAAMEHGGGQSRENFVAVERLLLAHGADINAQDKSGATPLWVASDHQNTDSFRFLLLQGSDLTLIAPGGRPQGEMFIQDSAFPQGARWIEFCRSQNETR